MLLEIQARPMEGTVAQEYPANMHEGRTLAGYLTLAGVSRRNCIAQEACRPFTSISGRLYTHETSVDRSS